MLEYSVLKQNLAKLNGNTYKVFMYVTLEYEYALAHNQDKCSLSYAEIRKATGIKKDDTIISSIQELKKLGLITHQTNWIGGNQKSRSVFTSIGSTPKKGVSNTPNNGVPVVQEMEYPVLQKMEGITNKDTNKETNKEANTPNNINPTEVAGNWGDLERDFEWLDTLK